MKLRLNKVLAQTGITSRRGGDRLIAEGRVSVGGELVRNPGTLVDPDVDRVTVDGSPLPAAETRRYFLLHKPRGYVTTRSDPRGRPVVTDLVPDGARLYPVGRLDLDVEGVLLLTNDGALTHRLLHPRYGLLREYEAEVAGGVNAQDLRRWRAGVELEDGPAIPVAVELLESAVRSSRVRLTFREGRKHEVKRFCEAVGHPVERLRRVAFGPIRLGKLPSGACRPLTSREIDALRAGAK